MSTPRSLALSMSRRASSTRVRLGEGRADLMSLCEEHRVGHAAAEQQGVDPAEQMLEHGELVGDFRPTEDSDEGPLGIVQEPRERGFLALEEQPGVGRQQIRHADGRGVCAVRGPEGVVDEEITEPSSDPRRDQASLASSPGSKRMFSSRRTSPGLRAVGGAFRLGAGDHRDRGNPLPEQLAQSARDWGHGIRGVRFPFGRPRWVASTTAAPWSSRY